MDNLFFFFFFFHSCVSVLASLSLFSSRHTHYPPFPARESIQWDNAAAYYDRKTDSVNHSGLAVFFCVAVRHDTLHFINHVLHFVPGRADVTCGDNIEDAP